MSADQPHHVLALCIAVATVLMGLWMEGGLLAVIVGAALTDLGLRMFGNRRSTRVSPVDRRN